MTRNSAGLACGLVAWGLLAAGCGPDALSRSPTSGDERALRVEIRDAAVTNAAGARDPADNVDSERGNRDASPTIPSGHDIVEPTAIETRIAADLQYLASDELGGRGPFTEGLEKAADYLARQFRGSGLETRRFGESPFQVFRSNVRIALGDNNRLEFRNARGAIGRLEHQRDFTPLSLSAAGSFDLPLAFAGHGITCPELALDDYAGLDVTGRMVIVLRHAPRGLPQLDVTQAKRQNGSLVEHTYVVKKVLNAIEHGASGLLLVTDAAHLPPAMDDAGPTIDPLLNFQVDGKLDRPAIPVLHCRREPIDVLLAAHGHPPLAVLERQLDERQEAAREANAEAPASPSIALDGCRAAGDVSIERRTLSLKNVLGELPGRGALADETVIVGAHYDHLGNGGAASLAPWTKAIHNGADDNASGTAALLEVARQVAARRNPEHARRVLFVAFSAEEMGLIGSERFVAAPPVPLREVVAMVNLDMVGRLRNERLMVSGTGTAKEFTPLVARLAAEHRFRAKLDPSGYGPSDHATFAARGIPVLHFFTGLHEDYHRPSDDFERINVPGLRRIVGLVVDAVLDITHADQRPTATGGGLDDLLADVTPRRPPSRNRPAAPTSPSETTPGEQDPKSRGLGIAVVDRPTGSVAIRRVTPGSVAERAGLRAGDIVRRVGASDVSSSAELIEAVKGHVSPAIETLRIERGSTQLEIDVEW